MWKRALRASARPLRRAAILVLGSAVLVFGILLIVLPGPAFLVIPAGLAILGLEFAWARRWMRIAQTRSRQTYARYFPGREPWRSF